MVRSTLVTACRLATSPTSTSPFLAKATTDGVVRAPSALAMTVGSPPSRTATTGLGGPRSRPTARGVGGGRRGGARARGVCGGGGLTALEDRDDGVGGTEVDADCSCHGRSLSGRSGGGAC